MADEIDMGPLSDIKVLEITQMVAGPLAGTMLADLGASIIKIEDLRGDPFRNVEPQYKGMCARFFAVNRGKRSIQLNLKSKEGREIAHSLAKQTDVVLVNSRPDAMKRLKLDYDSLSAINPGIIYVLISGFGIDGPYADRPAYDQVIQAITGAMYLQSPEGPPSPLRSMFVDKFAATAAASAVTAALYRREKNGGKGQFVSIPLMKAFGFFSLVDNLYNQCFVEADLKQPVVNAMRPFKSSDGTFMGYFQTDAQFELMARQLGVPHMLEDERFINPIERVRHIGELWSELENGAIKMTSEELEALAIEKGLPIAKVKSVEEFIDDPQARHIECIKQYNTEEYGPVRVASYPADFSESPAVAKGIAPRAGEHTDEILREVGMDEDGIARLRHAGAIG